LKNFSKKRKKNGKIGRPCPGAVQVPFARLELFLYLPIYYIYQSIEGGSMAKSGKAGKSAGDGKKTFEERLERLEELGEEIRKNDIPLDDALKAFEEGIKLARALEKDLEKIEGRIETLMNSPDANADESPELELFDGQI
jgi:exodeoxyribonuclease VII small subunit